MRAERPESYRRDFSDNLRTVEHPESSAQQNSE
jgi:hypothetical protein